MGFFSERTVELYLRNISLQCCIVVCGYALAYSIQEHVCIHLYIYQTHREQKPA